MRGRYRLVMSHDSELCPLLQSVYNTELTRILARTSLMTPHSYDVVPNPSAPTKTRFEQTDISAFTKVGLRTPPFIIGGPDGEGVAKFDLYNDGRLLPILVTAYALGDSFYSKLYILHDDVYYLSRTELERSLLLSGGVADTSLIAEDITLSGRFTKQFRPPPKYADDISYYRLRDWPVSGGMAEAFSKKALAYFPAITAASTALFKWKYNFIIADESTDLLLGPAATSTIDVYRMTSSGPEDVCYIYLPHND